MPKTLKVGSNKSSLVYRIPIASEVDSREVFYKWVFSIKKVKNSLWNISLRKIFNDAEGNYLTVNTKKHLCGRTTYNQSIRWIDKFIQKDDEYSLNFLKVKGLYIYNPKQKNTVIISYQNSKGRTITKRVDKKLLQKPGENISDFDGIERFKENNPGMDFTRPSFTKRKKRKTQKGSWGKKKIGPKLIYIGKFHY